MADFKEEVIIDYTNWRGERRTRRIRPIGMIFDSNEWHPEPQYFVEAMDIKEGARRTFAMANIHSWRQITR